MERITKIDAIKDSSCGRKLRVAAYARVSTSSEEQLLSLKTQKQHYEDYIKSNPQWIFAGIYFDEGISGTSTENRDGLTSMISDCESGKIDRVITKSISRFARNTTDCLELVRKLTRLKISIFFEKENIDTAHLDSELMLSIFSSIAESESRSISENQKWAIRKRYENGSYVIAYPPYGYKNIKGEMVVVPKEASVVKEIFSMAINGLGCDAIAKKLNADAVPTRRGRPWNPGTILDILANEKYVGDSLFQKSYSDEFYKRHENRGEKDQFLVRDHHEAIISREIFDGVQKEIQRRRKGKAFDNSPKSPFSMKLVCGECGSKFHHVIIKYPSKNYVVWSCAKHKRSKHDCSMQNIKEEVLERTFLKVLQKLKVGSCNILKPFVDSLEQRDEDKTITDIQNIDDSLDKLKESNSTLTQLIHSGYFDSGFYYQEIAKLEAEKRRLVEEKKKLSEEYVIDRNHLEEAKKLIKLLSKGSFDVFDEEGFSEVVDTITILSREKAIFNMKCGLHLEEKLEEA